MRSDQADTACLGRYPAATLADTRRPAFASFLNFARWSAAAMVFLGHLRDPLFFGYGAVAAGDRTAFVKLWYFVTGWHAEAVVVFFVLSGYLVGGLGSAKIHTGRFSPVAYGVERATRIYLPFLPALLLTAALDALGVAWFGAAGLYDHSQAMIHEKLALGAFTDFMSLPTFVANALLLQTFWSSPFGSNQPLWTISAEFWFYVVFGLTAAAFLCRTTWRAVASVVLAVAVVTMLGGFFVDLMGLWVIGIAAAFVPKGRYERPVIAAFLFLAQLTAIRLEQDVFEHSTILRECKNYVVAISFCWLLISMRHVESGLFEKLSQVNQFLAGFSYSLYLIHFPLLIFALSALYATGLFPGIALGYSPTNPAGLGLYAGLIAFVSCCAWLFAAATERNTGQLRVAILSQLQTHGWVKWQR